MVLKRKAFFLNLEETDAAGSTPPVQVAPVKAAPAEQATSAESAATPIQIPAGTSAPVSATEPEPRKASSTTPSLTTAEAIAAELAAAAAARPAMTVATYAPDALLPGRALRPQRRRPGANLKGFRSMAADLFKS